VNKVEMRRWRDALRQAHRDGVGQTSGTLYRVIVGDPDRDYAKSGFCCMGIRMESAADEGRVTREQGGSVMFYREPSAGTEDILESEALTPNEQELLDVNSSDPVLLDTKHAVDGSAERSLIWLPERNTNYPMAYSASALNDTLRLNFDQIADCMTWTFDLDGED
jgi:hypothetical protein